MMKSLLITLEFDPQVGGVATYYKNICRNLPADRIVVMAPPHVDSFSSDAKREFKIYRQNLLARFFWPRWLPLVWQIFQVAQKDGIEHLQVGQILPVGTAVYLLTRFWSCPYLVYVHGMDLTVPSQYRIKKFLIKKILEAADRVVTISQFTKERLIELGVDPGKIVMVYPAVKAFDVFEDTRALENELRTKHDLFGKRVLLTVGRLVKRKGQDTVIRALPEVLKHFPNLVYVMVGGGPDEPRLRQLCDKLKLNGQVIFTGQVTEKQKIAWYDLSEIFIMTPRQLSNLDVEGFGIVYLEANGLGKPVIGSRSGGVSDAVENGVNGLLIEPDNIELAAQAVLTLLSNHQLAQRLADHGQQRARSRFTWPVQADKIRQILSL